MKKKIVPRAVEAKQQPPKLNPFELKSSRKKFDVLGKRDKQAKKNVIKSREEAVNKRKKTLLVEYKQLRKANTFIDRRFGEDDPRLNDEDKALARFQAQRIREAKKSAKFHLSGDAQAAGRAGSFSTLTHGGRSLEELEELNSQPAELLGDLDDDVLEELVEQYHFGGGVQEQAADDRQEDGQQRRKTKKEIMEEIIAKSKAAKAEKARQKEADEEALAALDNTFKALVADASAGLGALVKPTGFDKGRRLKAETDDDAAYDRAARELVFEAKGQASERTLTAEELQEKEVARLAALEAARVKRMREDKTAGDGDEGVESGDDVGATAAAAVAPVGGYAAKRARLAKAAEEWENRQQRRLQQSGDALDDNVALSDDDEGEQGTSDSDGDDEAAAAAATNALEARRQAAAAGDHPLQKAFRLAAAKLAAKHGVEVEEQADSDDEDDEDPSDEDDEGGAGVSGDDNADDAAAAASGDDSSSSSSEDEDQQMQQAEQLDHPTKKLKQQQKQQTEAAAAGDNKSLQSPTVDGPLDLSFTPPVPETYREFLSLVGGRPADELQLAIQRIRTFNAAAMATDNKRKLQVFYGILVQHFVMLAGDQPTPVSHLDVLTRVILQLTPEVPFYAATVARTRIEKLHDRLAAHLADPLAAGPLMGWPGARQLLQLRLFSCLFPTSDKRHPVTTPLALLMGKYLMQCPVTNPFQAAVGLLLAGMALHNTAAAARFCPEVVSYLSATLQGFMPVAAAVAKAGASAAATVSDARLHLFSPGVLALDCCRISKKQRAGSKSQRKQQAEVWEQQQQQLPSLKLYQLLSSAADSAEFQTDEFKLQVLGCAVSTATRVCQLSSGCGDAAPEVLQPLHTAAAAVAGLQGLPVAAASAVSQLQQQLQETSAAVVAARLPMVQSHRVKLVAPKEYNPRYEADFSLAANYDPDRQRAAAQKLKRQLTKEKRGAMRELRRDAVFMSAERDAEKTRVDAERLASERAFYHELQVQEADAKSGGQKGMNPHKKKGKKR